MKFKWKILMMNLLVLSLLFSISGYIFIYNYYKTAINQEIESSINENELLKRMIKMEMRDYIETIKSEKFDFLETIQIPVDYNVKSSVLIMNEVNNLIYKSNDISDKEWTQDSVLQVINTKGLIGGLEKNKKRYIIYEDNHRKILMTADLININEGTIYVINSKNISDLYNIVGSQQKIYITLFVIAFIISVIAVYIISTYLTKSLNELHRVSRKIALGDFTARTKFTTKDEFGDLQQSFNYMAKSIEEYLIKLKEEGKKQEDFVSNFTHEIKTPLTTIIGYSDVLRAKNVDEDLRKIAAEYMYSEGKRLERISMKLLDLLEISKKNITFNNVYIKAILEDAIYSVAPAFKEKNISINLESYDGVVSGDYELLKTIFINFLDNARKASSENSAVVVKEYSLDSKIVIEIKDKGMGIPQHELNRLTEAFYMVDKSRGRSEGGAGIGLSICSKVIKYHNGELEFESKLNEGTTVIVKLNEVEECSMIGGNESE